MEFRYWVNKEEVQSLNEKERLIWTLDALQKASAAREEYFRQHNNLLGPLESFDPQIKYKHNVRRVIMVDLIFTLVRSIEAFFGAVGIAWQISTRESKISVRKLHEWLLRPGDSTLQKIKDILSEKRVDKDTLCKLSGFPIPENLDIEKKDQLILWKLYEKTLEWIRTYGFFAYWYLNEFKEVRNVYSHNMRFLFLDLLQRDGPERAGGIGLLSPKRRGPNYMILISRSQRKAMGELTIRMCLLERIIYQNLKFCVWNDCIPVLPAALVEIPKDLEDDLVRIKLSADTQWIIPPINIEVTDNESIETQYLLHTDLVHEIARVGGPDMI
ncbi:MAG: hypothetical protein ACFFEV_00060 [Candidatus Thorarchaeota archaeon]